MKNHVDVATVVAWAVERWNAEVRNRPLVNVHRRSLDDAWRQVMRHFGGDPDALVGASHDELLAGRTETALEQPKAVAAEVNKSGA